jgi:hypothetical protein
MGQLWMQFDTFWAHTEALDLLYTLPLNFLLVPRNL